MSTELATWNKQFDAVTRALNANVMYRLSLSSKELFHSNFLSWLLDSYPVLLRPLLDPSLPSNEIVQMSRREHAHLDLVLFPKDSPPFVVENKVFSPVDKDQLEKHDGEVFKLDGSPKVRVADCRRFILTLLEPRESTLIPEGWYHLRYDDLRERLTTGRVGVIQDPFHNLLVDGYLQLLDSLVELRDTVGDSTDGLPLDMTAFVTNESPNSRTRDFTSKARFTVALHELRKTNPSKVRYLVGFTHTRSLIQGFYPLKHSHYEVGWQYQDAQFRLALRLDPKTKNRKGETLRGNRVERERIAANDLAEWITEENLNAAFTTTRTSLRFEDPPAVTSKDRKAYKQIPPNGHWNYNSFDPDFVHRWVKLDDLTLSELVSANRALMKRAKEIEKRFEREY
jgi:hypothetical protein